MAKSRAKKLYDPEKFHSIHAIFERLPERLPTHIIAPRQWRIALAVSMAKKLNWDDINRMALLIPDLQWTPSLK